VTDPAVDIASAKLKSIAGRSRLAMSLI